MASWEEGGFQMVVSTASSAATAVELWQNNDEPFHNRTIVDGFLAVVTDQDEMCVVKLIGPVPDFAIAADFGFRVPERSEPISWYSFPAARGPLIYRIRSKRTVGPKEEIWAITEKIVASASTIVNVYWQFLITP